jgi:hypothetical protein
LDICQLVFFGHKKVGEVLFTFPKACCGEIIMSAGCIL